MLKKLSIENFKGIKSDVINITPLTLLIGANSSGKSTLLQTILFVKQSLWDNTKKPFIFNGSYINLRDFTHTLYGEKADNMTINFEFEVPFGEESLEDLYTLLNQLIIKEKKQLFITKNKLLIQYKICLKYSEINKEQEVVSDISYKFSLVDENSITIEDLIDIKISLEKEVIQKKKNKSHKEKTNFIYFFEWSSQKLQKIQNNTLRAGKILIRTNLNNLMLQSLDMLNEENISTIIQEKGSNYVGTLTSITSNSRDSIYNYYIKTHNFVKNLFTFFKYITAQRQGPETDYEVSINDTNSDELNKNGSNASEIYFHNKDEKFYFDYFFKEKQIHNEAYEETLEFLLSEWLSKFGVNGFNVKKKDSPSSRIAAYVQSKAKENYELRITNAGFGLSQILPVLIQGLILKPYQILLIEDPESHIQPKMQSILGDFFIFLALSKRFSIIETHSSSIAFRLITSFQTLKKENNLNITVQKLIRILMVESSFDRGAIFKNKELDGNVEDDWAVGFFDSNDKDNLLDYDLDLLFNQKKEN